tara:strand:+ start:447 stop:590 length:144 start_codon:yes stop_codon:yes gene_type:complete
LNDAQVEEALHYDIEEKGWIEKIYFGTILMRYMIKNYTLLEHSDTVE